MDEQRVIAVIGTAGRDKAINMRINHWDFMTDMLRRELKPDDHLVSGGAAWADHVAVWAYLEGHVEKLTLHLPAPFDGKYFRGAYGTSGGTCNYYHDKFSHVLGLDSLVHIQMAKAKGATITHQPVAQGYGAMAARNRLVAADCTHMIAFTFGRGDVPADGGTKMTWDMAADKYRVHVPLPI